MIRFLCHMLSYRQMSGSKEVSAIERYAMGGFTVVSKQKILKGCHQGQNISVLAILERLAGRQYSLEFRFEIYFVGHASESEKYVKIANLVKSNK